MYQHGVGPKGLGITKARSRIRDLVNATIPYHSQVCDKVESGLVRAKPHQASNHKNIYIMVCDVYVSASLEIRYED